MKLEHFIHRYTWLRKCFLCDKWCHLTRPVDFGVDVEDVCIPCICKANRTNWTRKPMLPDTKYLRREESFVFILFMVLALVAGVRFGIEVVFVYLQ